MLYKQLETTRKCKTSKIIKENLQRINGLMKSCRAETIRERKGENKTEERLEFLWRKN